MTSTSTRGLLPELTEVLHALTDAQRLLVLKLRGVRLEYENDGFVATHSDFPQQAIVREFAEFTGARLMKAGSPCAVLDVRPAPCAHDAKASTGGLPLALLDVEVDQSETAVTSPTSVVVASEVREAAPAAVIDVPPAEATAHLSEAQCPEREPDGAAPVTPPLGDRTVVREAAAPAAVSDRRYNFFDDLDANVDRLGRREEGDS